MIYWMASKFWNDELNRNMLLLLGSLVMDDNNFIDDDNDLWQSAISEVKPLKSKEKLKTKAAVEIKDITENKLQEIPVQLPPPRQVQNKYLAAGDMSRVDGAVAHKLKAGTYPLDATLDLHSRTQDEAFEALRYFISTAYSMEKRCVRVITGKGLQGEGVLRAQFPVWLSAPGIEEYILAFNRAIQQHGGDGAFYVLLRKNK